MPTLLGQSFPFVHPGLAGAAVALGAIPIIVHLIHRRRHVRVRWAAMQFLMRASRRNAKRMRLQNFLLMAVRIAMIVLFGFAIARPFLPSSSFIAHTSARVHRVILLDNSLSMSATDRDGESRFAAARVSVERLLESFPEADGVSIVTLSSPAEAIIERAAFDRRFVHERLMAVQSTQLGDDVLGGLALAADIFNTSESPQENRVVYFISDFQGKDWSSDSGREDRPAMAGLRRFADKLNDSATDLVVVPLAGTDGRNASVSSIRMESPLVAVDAPARVLVEVSNHGTKSLHDLTLRVRRDGRIIREEKLAKIGPHQSRVTMVTTQFSSAGTHIIEAEITGASADDLGADDVRRFSLDVRRSVPVLLVDGRPGLMRFDGQASFLATALAPRLSPDEQTMIDPRIISDAELVGEDLSSYDVIALCNVARLAPVDWNRIEEFVREGGGLLVFVGDLVSGDNYNELGYANGHGVLPVTLGPAIILASESPESMGFKPGTALRPFVEEILANPDSGLRLARVDRYLSVIVDPNRADMLLRFANDDPALIASSVGEGRVLLWTTTVNMDWTNLPAKGDFVSLMLGLVTQVAPVRGGHRNILVGETIHERLTAVESSLPLRVIAGEPGAEEPHLVPDGDTLALEYGPMDEARAVSVSIGSGVRRFAVNLESRESNIVPASMDRFEDLLNRPFRLLSSGTAPGVDASIGRSAELASLSLYLVAGLLVLEMLMALWFGGATLRAKRPERSGVPRAGIVVK